MSEAPAVSSNSPLTAPGQLASYPPELLQGLVEATADGMLVLNREGRVVACNSGMALIAGRPIKELVGSSPDEWGTWQAGDTAEDWAWRTSGEALVRRPDGSVRRVTVRAFSVPGNPSLRGAVYRELPRVPEARARSADEKTRALALLDYVHDGILVHRKGRILYANQRLARMLECERRDLLLLDRQELGPVPEQLLGTTGMRGPRFDTILRRGDGSVIEVEIAASASLYEGESAVFEVVRDATERRRAEKRANAFLNLGQLLNEAAAPRDAARAVISAAEGLVDYDVCSVEVIEGEGADAKLIPLLYIDTIDGVKQEVEAPQHSAATLHRTEQVLRQGQKLILRGEDEGDSGVGTARRGGRPLSMLYVPIRSGGEPVGVLSVQSFSPNAYGASDLEVLQALADYCSGALERARAIVRLQESEDLYRQMFEGIRAITMLIDPETGVIVDCNQAAGDYYGYGIEGLRGRTAYQISVAPAEVVKDRLKMAVEGGRGAIASVHQIASGAARDVEMYASPVKRRGRVLLHAIVHDVTDRNRAVVRGQAVAELGHRLSAAMSLTEVGRIVLDVAKRIISWDAAFMNLLSSELENEVFPPDLLVPIVHYDTIDEQVRDVSPALSRLNPDSISTRALREGPQLVLRKSEADADEHFTPYGDTDRRSLSLMYVPISGPSGSLGLLSIQSYRQDAYTLSDLELLQVLADHCSGAMVRTRSEQQVKLLESAVRLATDMVMIAMADPDADGGSRVIFVNEAYVRQAGWSRNDILGQPGSVLYGPMTAKSEVERMRVSLESGRPVRVEMALHKRDGTSFEAEVSSFPITDDAGRIRYYVSVMRDITERRRAQQQLEWHAFHDPLTQLPNRTLFHERLEHALSRRQRAGQEAFAVLYIDLDGFKAVNDNYGHAAGDEVLVQTARRLESCVRPGDTVARLGGDEFVVLLEGANDPQDIFRVAERIVESTTQPVQMGDMKIDCTASLGVAIADSTVTDGRQLLRIADAAMYQAKAGGKGRFHAGSTPSPE